VVGERGRGGDGGRPPLDAQRAAVGRPPHRPRRAPPLKTPMGAWRAHRIHRSARPSAGWRGGGAWRRPANPQGEGGGGGGGRGGARHSFAPRLRPAFPCKLSCPPESNTGQPRPQSCASHARRTRPMPHLTTRRPRAGATRLLLPAKGERGRRVPLSPACCARGARATRGPIRPIGGGGYRLSRTHEPVGLAPGGGRARDSRARETRGRGAPDEGGVDGRLRARARGETRRGAGYGAPMSGSMVVARTAL